MPQPTVAILGASSDRRKYGNISVRAHAQHGYAVYPVNPKGGQIEGLPVHLTLADVPVERLDRISVYLPPAVALAALDEIAAKGCDELWFNPGSHDAAVVAKAESLGLRPILACSIVDLGVSPAEFSP